MERVKRLTEGLDFISSKCDSLSSQKDLEELRGILKELSGRGMGS
ncbi:MAG: hypothetical protein QMC89_03835 [Candidatus Hodarchaeaceae archaeon]|nr:hypothetical protein [Candidatus Hodarchaeaceae archaeon]